MKRHSITVPVVFLLLSCLALAQQPAEPPVFTYVAEWTIARADWDQFNKTFEQSSRPILDRLLANGTIIGYGSFATYVHEADAPTHGDWWSASSLANIEKARAELIKAAVNPAMAAAKHRDYLLRSIFHKGSMVKPGPGFLVVSESQVQAGKGADWRQLWEKYTKPVYDQLVADGTITQYSVDVEQVHTQDPGTRYIWYTTSGADGVDKVGAALNAAAQARGEQEQRTIGLQMQAVTNGAAHRDYWATIATYAHK